MNDIIFAMASQLNDFVRATYKQLEAGDEVVWWHKGKPQRRFLFIKWEEADNNIFLLLDSEDGLITEMSDSCIFQRTEHKYPALASQCLELIKSENLRLPDLSSWTTKNTL